MTFDRRSAAYALFNEEIDEDAITPGTRVIEERNAQDKQVTHFGPQFLQKAEERGIGYRLSPEERAEIENEVKENGWGSLCRCTQADFNDASIEVRNNKAMMVNLYFEYGGNWMKVFRDPRSVSRRAMAVYWCDDIFKEYIRALDPILMLEARGVVVEVWKDGLDEKARLAAALRFLEQADAYNWDRGVRKQVVANKGSLQSALFNKVISDEEFLNTYIKDKLNKLPDDVRNALSGALPSPSRPQAATEEWAPPQTIQTMDMNKLKDPFGEYDDARITDSDEES